MTILIQDHWYLQLITLPTLTKQQLFEHSNIIISSFLYIYCEIRNFARHIFIKDFFCQIHKMFKCQRIKVLRSVHVHAISESQMSLENAFFLTKQEPRKNNIA